jgi:hypothetical protein
MATDHFRDAVAGAEFPAKQAEGEIAVTGQGREDKRRSKREITYLEHGLKEKITDGDMTRWSHFEVLPCF